MSKFYKLFNPDADSFSVFEAGRKNEFGEPYCHVPMVTREQAETAIKLLENGLPVDITGAPEFVDESGDGYGDPRHHDPRNYRDEFAY